MDPNKIDGADGEDDRFRSGIVQIPLPPVTEIKPGGKERVLAEKLKNIDVSIKIADREWGKLSIRNGKVVLVQQNGQSVKILNADKVENVGPQGSVVVSLQEKSVCVENRYSMVKASLEPCDKQWEDFEPVGTNQSWVRNTLLRILDWVKSI